MAKECGRQIFYDETEAYPRYMPYPIKGLIVNRANNGNFIGNPNKLMTDFLRQFARLSLT